MPNTGNELNNSDIVYNKDDYVSKPWKVKNGTVPINFLEFDHSYGYNCRKYFNLCVADPETIIFSSGNLIHFFNVKTKKLLFRRGSEEGIGHIAKNPKFAHIAVGERGYYPLIIIYEWPTLRIITILKSAAVKAYSYLTYSPSGQLLISQSGKPDFLLTVWKWQEAAILLQTQSHTQDVFNVRFSEYITNHFVTCGVNHVKFWSMDCTFTGLKLKEELGRFGDVPFSDIVGVYSMPDGKILSGSNWGNILVWNKGCIEIEVRRKNKKSCHEGMITQFKYLNGELMSVGVDGWVRVWYYDTIGLANFSTDDRYLEIEPIYEFEIGAQSNGDNHTQKKLPMLMAIEKKDPDDPEETFWYGQDGNGGLWLVDLSTNQLQKPSEKIFTCHAGTITDIFACPWGNYIASCGEEGHINIYNYSSKNLIVSHHFREICCQVIWLSCSMESTGSTLICGFQSGVVRVLMIDINQAEIFSNKENKKVEFNEENLKRSNFVRLISVVKPHKKAITVMILNNIKRLLVTGSKDASIFCFSIDSSATYPTLTPIGFINLPASISCITWNPKNNDEVLIGCSKGYFATTKLPNKPQAYTTVSYELFECCLNLFQFNSSEEVEEQEEKPLDHINNILTINYFTEDKVWLTMSNNNSGYIYEYSLANGTDGKKEVISKLKPTKIITVIGVENEEVTSCLYYDIKNDDKEIKYLIMGTEKGKIQVCKVKDEDFSDLSDYWVLQMHDNLNGIITKICLSYDKQFLFTSGNDGNIFSYLMNEKNSIEIIKNEYPAALTILPENVEDIEDDDHPSLEEMITKAEKNRIESEMKRKKEKILATLRNLNEEYREIMNRNRKLVKSQQISLEEFELDPRITEDLDNQLEQEIELVKKQMAFQVEKSTLALKKLIDYFIKPVTHVPFAVCKILKPTSMVHSIQVKALDDEFYAAYNQVHKQIEETKVTSLNTSVKLKKNEERMDDEKEETEDEDKEDYKIQEVESFLRGLSAETIQHKLGIQIYQVLRKYRERKAQMEQRAREWKIMYVSKPDLKADHEEDIEAIEEAKRTIGDYKLKISDNFTGDMKAKQATLLKHQQLLECKKENYLLRERFNEKLKRIRDDKLKLQKEVIDLLGELSSIHGEISEKYQKPFPKIFDINWDIEFPEKNLELEKYIPISEKIKEARRQKQTLDEPFFQNLTSIDEEHEVLLSDETVFDLECKLPRFLSDYPIYQTTIDVSQNLIDSLNANDRVQTPWEIEMKLARMVKKIYRQECILNYINDSYKSIDAQLDELEEERLQIQADGIYSDLFQCTLQQELIILRNFEMRENILTQKVEENLENRSEIQQKVNGLTVILEHKMKEIAQINDKIKDLTTQFNNMVNDNKFTEFFKRVYKKKYREIRISEELSDSSSTESINDKDDDDDDEDDLDDNFSDEDQNVELPYLDDNYCPAGCDEELFRATISMRKKRHDYEAKVRENQKIAEGLKKDIEKEHKRLKMVENTWNVSQRELQDFMSEKQKKLNDIDVTVVLKLHQLQHFISEEILAKIRDCVVFDQSQLSKLYTRVGDLQQETLDQKTKHEKNKNHLHRLELDCKYMEDEIKRLKAEIKEEMSRKFGKEISLIKLYEAVLRRMIFDIRADIKDETKVYDKKIHEVKTKYHEQISVLENLIKENTEKLNILTTLEEKQHKLRKILQRTPESIDNIMKIKSDYEEDLRKLEEILQHQKNQKELFKYEIRNLRLKTRSLPPIHHQAFQRKVFDLNEDKMTDLGEFPERDFYASPENDGEADKNGKKDEILPKMVNKTNDQNIPSCKMDFEMFKDETEEINWNIELKVEELLDLLEIKADPRIKLNIIQCLRHENGVKMAVDFISTKLSSSNIEITTALKDYAFQVLEELKKKNVKFC